VAAQFDKTQRSYARLAGFLYLAVIIVALGSGLILSHVAGAGSFAETAARIAGSERLYRGGLATAVLATMGSALLAFALYATLKPVDSLLAQLAMIFTLGDSFLALLVRMCGFVRLHFYLAAQGTGAGTSEASELSNLLHNIASATENIGGIAFGIGSLIFFYLFFRSRYIPRMLSGLGVFASAIWTALYFASLVFPEKRDVFQYICFPPMALADIITGFYLMLFGVKASQTN
jgi:Domain of unknown function (DUF4386)